MGTDFGCQLLRLRTVVFSNDLECEDVSTEICDIGGVETKSVDAVTKRMGVTFEPFTHWFDGVCDTVDDAEPFRPWFDVVCDTVDDAEPFRHWFDIVCAMVDDAEPFRHWFDVVCAMVEDAEPFGHWFDIVCAIAEDADLQHRAPIDEGVNNGLVLLMATEDRAELQKM